MVVRIRHCLVEMKVWIHDHTYLRVHSYLKSDQEYDTYQKHAANILDIKVYFVLALSVDNLRSKLCFHIVSFLHRIYGILAFEVVSVNSHSTIVAKDVAS